MAQTGERVDPTTNCVFMMQIDAVVVASFAEVGGLDSTTDIVTYREGGYNSTVRKLPGLTSYSDISLKWGLTSSTELWDWRQSVIDGIFTRRNATVIAYDPSRSTEVTRWNIYQAWPSHYAGPAFNAKANEVAIETLTLAHEGLTRA